MSDRLHNSKAGFGIVSRKDHDLHEWVIGVFSEVVQAQQSPNKRECYSRP